MLLIVLFPADDASRFLSSNIEFHIFSCRAIGNNFSPIRRDQRDRGLRHCVGMQIYQKRPKERLIVSIYGPKSL